MVTALILTWFLGGLWHGAAWHFVVWGLYHGALVVLGSALYPYFGKYWDWLLPPLRITVTFTLVCIGWVLFRAPDLTTAVSMIFQMVQPWKPGYFTDVPLSGSLLFVAILGGGHYVTNRLYEGVDSGSRLVNLPYRIQLSVISLAFFGILLFSGGSQTFIYFQF